MMYKYKIIVAYDGTDFHGWQIQPVDISIASTLANVFKKTFFEEIIVTGASRTDAGVHAFGQVAHFSTTVTIDPERIRLVWNASLPPAIIIRSIELVDNDFHACFNVEQKTYYYHLFLKRPLPFLARFGWYYRFIHYVDLKKFEKGLQTFIGTHDFTALCKLEPDKTPIRTIDSISVQYIKPWGMLRVIVKGKSFLRYQIRRIVGYSLDVARRPELPVHYLEEILKSKNPQQTLLQADAIGLCLRKIVYKRDRERIY